MLKLNVGTNRKIGQPDYGSAGASCNLEVELDTALFHDLDGLHHVIQRAYAACNQAVNDELARLSASTGPSSGSNGHQHHQHNHLHHDHHQALPATAPIHEVLVSPVIHGARFSSAPPHAHPTSSSTTSPTTSISNRPNSRPATTSQVRAIRAICGRRKIDLLNLLRERYGIQTADELGIRQASDLIDELKNAREDGGNNASTPNGSTNDSPNNGNGHYAGSFNGGAR